MNAIAAHQPFPQLYDRVARIAAATTKSEVAFVTVRMGRKLTVIGSHGVYFETKDGDWDGGPNVSRIGNMAFIPNVKRDANFKDHPLLTAAPFAKTLLHVPARRLRTDVEASITLINIDMKWPLTATITAVLTDLAMLIGDAIEMDTTFPELVDGAAHAGGFEEHRIESEEPSSTTDTSGQFLLSTLLQRTSIRSRKEVAYITLRTWSKPIKTHQIKALAISKIRPDERFVECVATEIAQHVRKFFGNPRFSAVVPVPCGHCKHDGCLSVRIAKQVGQILEIQFVDALERENRQGSSHPRKNVGLRAPKLKTAQKFESILLIDDVATSGRHMELAVMSLRHISEHITAIAWIGPS